MNTGLLKLMALRPWGYDGFPHLLTNFLAFAPRTPCKSSMVEAQVKWSVQAMSTWSILNF
jgi:hypothetical protein